MIIVGIGGLGGDAACERAERLHATDLLQPLLQRDARGFGFLSRADVVGSGAWPTS